MKLKKILIPIAPILGALMSSPLSGIATQTVSQVLFRKPNASRQELEKSLKNASVEQLNRLKKIDAQYHAQLLKLELELDEKKRTQP